MKKDNLKGKLLSLKRMWRRYWPLCASWLLIATLSLVWLASSCSGTKRLATSETLQEEHSRHSMKVDSTFHATASWMKRERVQADTTMLTLSTTQLQQLPPSAVYEQQKGRARLRVERKGENIIVTSTCDSLQALVEYYSSLSAGHQLRATMLRDSLHHVQVRQEKQTRSPISPFSIGTKLLLGLLAIAAVGFYLSKNKPKLWQ